MSSLVGRLPPCRSLCRGQAQPVVASSPLVRRTQSAPLASVAAVSEARMEDWNCTRCRSRNTDLYKGRRRDKCTSCYLSRDKAKPVPAVVPTVLSKSPGAACVPPTTGTSGHTTPRRDFPSSNGVTPAAGASGIVNPETHQPRPQHQSLPQPSPQLLPPFSPAVHPSPHHLHQPPPPSHQPQGPPPPQVLAPWMAPLPPPPQAPNKDEGAGVFDYEWTREKAAARQLPPLAVHTTADAAPECAVASRTCGCQPSHTHTHTHRGLTPPPAPAAQGVAHLGGGGAAARVSVPAAAAAATGPTGPTDSTDPAAAAATAAAHATARATPAAAAAPRAAPAPAATATNAAAAFAAAAPAKRGLRPA